MIVTFIDDQRDQFGVAPICEVLQVAPSTYYSSRSRPLSARAIRDAVMMPILLGLWKANYSVYGARKLWVAARKAGHVIGRDQVARLMRELGIRGVKRSRRVRTTRPDPSAARSPDLVNRNFTADRPNALWVTDLTFVATWSGVAYVCFIVDAFSRKIVGWRVAAHMRTVMILDALEMARWSRDTNLEGLVAHSDRGAQGEFKWSSQHLDRGGVDGQASWVDEGVDGEVADEVAGGACSSARGRARVLACDRNRGHEREGCSGCWGVAGCGESVVPSWWWDGSDGSWSSVWPLSLVR